MATNLMRFDPFSDIARLDPFRNIEDIFRDFSMMPVQRGMQTAPQIRMDISETDQAYMIKADIPGVSKEDIKIAIEGNQVSVSAETKEEKDTSTAGMLRSERYYGQQYRSFSLPQEVDDAAAQAKYENGVLQLTLPKKPGTGAKQLTIQ
jgi:HSP20 family protein